MHRLSCPRSEGLACQRPWTSRQERRPAKPDLRELSRTNAQSAFLSGAPLSGSEKKPSEHLWLLPFGRGLSGEASDSVCPTGGKLRGERSRPGSGGGKRQCGVLLRLPFQPCNLWRERCSIQNKSLECPGHVRLLPHQDSGSIHGQCSRAGRATWLGGFSSLHGLPWRAHDSGS